MGLNTIIGAIAGAVVAGLIAYGLGQWIGWTQGYNEHQRQMVLSEIDEYRERQGDDAEIQAMSDYELCISMSRGDSVRDDWCKADWLRGPESSETEPAGVVSPH